MVPPGVKGRAVAALGKQKGALKSFSFIRQACMRKAEVLPR